ncbi:hypothetical protein Bcav_0294 [Beutenbergia cavernae DSM 12333]|uniref:Uncharacterized protein n=1 Tax=Beutenbergia cavernae (strain ATCC BAA-8 / DSM 12333 / CCUG 43141 / JCM 11478 / NBRC 16432 / NCIMB 13614 / HKI 0122) TaxID=471853 RepID=C5BWA1_BEUC1|nr:DUF6069 family protein [Beutenbergia cavernae]ACQ78559.1 hypothetical protein Bcav_0294 [Beutenbergia cavernae DSM 12333]
MSRTTPEVSAGPTAELASAAPARRLPRWIVPFAAAAAGAAVWLVGAAAGVGPVVVDGTEVGVVAVVVAGLVAGLLGWGVRALVGRIARRRGRTGQVGWLVTCAVVLLLSLSGPLGAEGGAAVTVLVAEHVVVGAVIALGLRR